MRRFWLIKNVIVKYNSFYKAVRVSVFMVHDFANFREAGEALGLEVRYPAAAGRADCLQDREKSDRLYWGEFLDRGRDGKDCLRIGCRREGDQRGNVSMVEAKVIQTIADRPKRHPVHVKVDESHRFYVDLDNPDSYSVKEAEDALHYLGSAEDGFLEWLDRQARL